MREFVYVVMEYDESTRESGIVRIYKTKESADNFIVNNKPSDFCKYYIDDRRLFD